MHVSIGPVLLLCVAVCSSVHIDEHLFVGLLDRLDILEQKDILQNDAIARLQHELDDERSVRKATCGHAVKTGSHRALQMRTRGLNATVEGPVAFSAAIQPKTVDHVRKLQTFVFDTVLINFGHGYDKNTGVFTVPHTGIYFFSCSVLDHSSNGGHGTTQLHAEMVRNGHVLVRVFAHAASYYRDQGAQTIVAKVNAGDKIWIRNQDNDNLGVGGELYTTFSGYMLWQLP